MPIVEDCVSCGGKGTFHLVDMKNPDEFKEIICEVCQGKGMTES